MVKKKQIRIVLSADKSQGDIDGYAEMILGIFAMSHLLMAHKLSKRKIDTNTVIVIDALLADAPLGHLGTGDIDETD
jgi:hypothetical protein